MTTATYELVVVANRLPLEWSESPPHAGWRPSPGGLVTALSPVLAASDGAWIGWGGQGAPHTEPFSDNGIYMVPVVLSDEDVAEYYEGFANGTLWPLYHDVIAPPEYHRAWWDRYVAVNERFAEAAAQCVAPGGVVWVHDYQLQLVPRMVRDRRDDVRIAFFNHIPFPPAELMAQLPWRNHVLTGLLGADVVGFQRDGDAENYLDSCSKILGVAPVGNTVSTAGRTTTAAAFPISIDTAAVEDLARSDDVTARLAQIRATMGGRQVVLGVDRLDYTKGIPHRLKAYGELLEDGRVNPRDTVLVQVATPSREQVAHYVSLRDDVELTVGRLNGDYSTLGRPAVHYLHQNYDSKELAAMYRCADVMLVTSLRDGMNLVAKEYIASRFDNRGSLILSEFAGAADELEHATIVNPHDIDGLKDAIVEALSSSFVQQRRTMSLLRAQVSEFTVQKWARDVLRKVGFAYDLTPELTTDLPSGTLSAVEAFANHSPVLIACDFDGTLSPLVDNRDQAAPLAECSRALERLISFDGVHLSLVSGRSLASLSNCAAPPPGTHLIAGHGAEIDGRPIELRGEQTADYVATQQAFENLQTQYDGVDIELKPTAIVLHTRLAAPDVARLATRAAIKVGRQADSARVIVGRDVVEVSVTSTDKGQALVALRDSLGAAATLYAGDDTTDEDAFNALADSPSTGMDFTIKVGDGPTAAGHRVSSPAAVASLLHALADAFSASAPH